MGLSKRHLNPNPEPVTFELAVLASGLEDVLPEVVFAYLHGSVAGGRVGQGGCLTVAAHSDLDLAFFLNREAAAAGGSLDIFVRAAQVCDRVVPGVRADIGLLNRAEPVYRFEVLKGIVLFNRDRETWLRFWSLTGREYESQLFHYQRQRRYRLEAAS